MSENIKVVILCGGMGTRLREETEYKPKPLVEIGGKPMLWHIMKIYSYYGFKDFVLCLGYKGKMIKDYFLYYEIMNSDFTLKLESKGIEFHNSYKEKDWIITFAETGKNAMTGARIKRIEKYINSELFILTYGDGVADINIQELLKFHKSHGKIGTVTGVNPSSRFGELVITENQVKEFSEKPQIKDGFINGGFFIFNKRIFNYLEDNDDCIFEREPLRKLSHDKELMVYRHKGFWQCMDTYRDLQLLNNLWVGKEIEKELHFNSIKRVGPPWKVWKE